MNEVPEPLANNGCFSGFAVLALSKYSKICSSHRRIRKDKQNFARKPEMKE
jgi:hypothetical protein